MADELKITVEGVQSKEDMDKLLRAINEDINNFDPYMEKVGGGKLTSYEASAIRSFLVWKVIKPKDEDIRTVSN